MRLTNLGLGPSALGPKDSTGYAGRDVALKNVQIRAADTHYLGRSVVWSQGHRSDLHQGHSLRNCEKAEPIHDTARKVAPARVLIERTIGRPF